MFYYKLTKNKRTKRDILIMLLIVISPFLFFTYNLAPSGQKWDTPWFTIDAGLFEDVDFYLWHFFIKILTLVILCFWFLTSVDKWKYILLISIFLELNKCVALVIESQINLSRSTLYISNYTFLLAIPVFIVLFWANSKLAYGYSEKSINALLNEEINNEFEKLSKFDLKIYESVNKDFKQLKNQKPEFSKKVYLAQLISLRDRINHF